MFLYCLVKMLCPALELLQLKTAGRTNLTDHIDPYVAHKDEKCAPGIISGGRPSN